MSNNIEDKKGNYEVVRNILSSRYQEVNGYDFYRYIFPDRAPASIFEILPVMTQKGIFWYYI